MNIVLADDIASVLVLVLEKQDVDHMLHRNVYLDLHSH
jgi:hypothetical protein